MKIKSVRNNKTIYKNLTYEEILRSDINQFLSDQNNKCISGYKTKEVKLIFDVIIDYFNNIIEKQHTGK